MPLPTALHYRCIKSGHPLDTIKVRIQTAAPGVYSGIFDVVKKAMVCCPEPARSGASFR